MFEYKITKPLFNEQIKEKFLESLQLKTSSIPPIISTFYDAYNIESQIGLDIAFFDTDMAGKVLFNAKTIKTPNKFYDDIRIINQYKSWYSKNIYELSENIKKISLEEIEFRPLLEHCAIKDEQELISILTPYINESVPLEVLALELLYSGISIKEAVDILEDDVNIEEKYIYVNGKIVHISDTVIEWIKKYRETTSYTDIWDISQTKADSPYLLKKNYSKNYYKSPQIYFKKLATLIAYFVDEIKNDKLYHKNLIMSSHLNRVYKMSQESNDITNIIKKEFNIVGSSKQTKIRISIEIYTKWFELYKQIFWEK